LPSWTFRQRPPPWLVGRQPRPRIRTCSSVARPFQGGEDQISTQWGPNGLVRSQDGHSGRGGLQGGHPHRLQTERGLVVHSTNRTSAPGRTFTYTDDGELATCSGTPACSPTFDADWRLTRIVTLADGTWSYLYDAESRLVSACKSTSCAGWGFARLGRRHVNQSAQSQSAQSQLDSRGRIQN